MDFDAIEELAVLQQVSAATVQTFVAALSERAGANRFYIFWNSSQGTGGGQRTGRTRTLLAFVTADAALTFTQRNQLAGQQAGGPRVRRLSLAQLLLAMLREPSIATIRLVSGEELPVVGQLPPGILIERQAVLEQLRTTS